MCGIPWFGCKHHAALGHLCSSAPRPRTTKPVVHPHSIPRNLSNFRPLPLSADVLVSKPPEVQADMFHCKVEHALSLKRKSEVPHDQRLAGVSIPAASQQVTPLFLKTGHGIYTRAVNSKRNFDTLASVGDDATDSSIPRCKASRPTISDTTRSSSLSTANVVFNGSPMDQADAHWYDDHSRPSPEAINNIASSSSDQMPCNTFSHTTRHLQGQQLEAESKAVPFQGSTGAPAIHNPEGRNGAVLRGINFRGDAMDQIDAQWYNLDVATQPQTSFAPVFSPASHVFSSIAPAIISARGTKRPCPFVLDDRSHMRFSSKRSPSSAQPQLHSSAQSDVSLTMSAGIVQQSSSSSSSFEGLPHNHCSVHLNTTHHPLGFPDDHG